MPEILDILIGCEGENLSGVSNNAWIIADCDLDSQAGTYAEAATEFNDQTAYAVNDEVNYKGSVYTCTTIHAAAAWNAANFTIIVNGNVRIKGAHVPATGKGFALMEINEEESTHKHESLGKKYSRNGKNSADLYYPGNSISASELAFQIRYAKTVTVIIELPDGRKIQIGTPTAKAECPGGYEGGTQSNPDSRWMFPVTAYGKSVTFYEAAVPLLP